MPNILMHPPSPLACALACVFWLLLAALAWRAIARMAGGASE